ncbi:MAG: response regulator transcription factor [Desulfobacter sp.]|nr:MAG: response regulator transcription factor [Desulfobacter sp.]
MDTHILVVEDNHDLAKLLELNFKDETWQVELAFDGNRGFKRARTGRYSLIVLDIMLPGMDGISILKQLRAEKVQTPVIMLTSKASEVDRILGLEFGADDYVTKPFSVRELVARIKALFRRIEAVEKGGADTIPEKISVGDLAIVPEKREVTRAGETVALTAREFDLLYFFARHPGRVFNRAQLLEHVWGYGHDGYEHAVNSNINRLRAKIETDPAAPEYVLTVWGVGYKFREG